MLELKLDMYRAEKQPEIYTHVSNNVIGKIGNWSAKGHYRHCHEIEMNDELVIAGVGVNKPERFSKWAAARQEQSSKQPSL
jgi:hypothetical protein